MKKLDKTEKNYGRKSFIICENKEKFVQYTQKQGCNNSQNDKVTENAKKLLKNLGSWYTI